MELTQEYLKECFDYDPATGNLVWRERPQSHFKNWQACAASSRYIGRVAGRIQKNGYRYINLGKLRLAHRLIWFWHNGRFPVTDIDHINRNRSDNRIENLRECTKVQNMRGRFIRQFGSRGVRVSSRNRWRARIWVDGRRINLGSFKSEKDAALAYARAAVDHFGAFAPTEAKELFNEAYP